MTMRMLKVFLLVFTLLLFSNVFAQNKDGEVLMTIAGDPVTRTEFIDVYLKNNISNNVIDKKSLEEYLDLYINFKLKVKEAEELGLDTVQAYIDELKGYRNQLAQPYLVDEEVTERMVSEAFERMHWDIRASHILIRVTPEASPQDTLIAYNKILELREMILQGEDFGDLAVQYSEDPSAKDRAATQSRPPTKGNKGDLGFFTVFDMVYPFENGAFNTPVGEVSMPVRTSYGYHLIYTAEKNDAMGKVQVAHILLLVPAKSTSEDSLAIQKRAQSAYEEIIQGADFAEVVKKYSDDKGTVDKGGVLPWFGVNRMIPDFIEQISDLEEIGNITEPFITQYGWHIVKLLDRKEVGSLDDNLQDIKQKIAKSDRAEESKNSFIRKLKLEYGYKVFWENLNDLYNVVDDSIFLAQWDVNKAVGLNKPLFELDGKKYTQWDFAQYMDKAQGRGTKMEIDNYVNKKFKDFSENTIIDYENSQLENKYPEFKALIKEYRDGILLFELTDEKIWSRALSDTTGLETFYENNKNNYMWNERADASIYTILNQEYLKPVKKMAKKNVPKNDILNQINQDSIIHIIIVREKYQKGDNEMIDSIEWKEGFSKNIQENDTVVFVKIHELLAPQPKSLSEARGIITADYQNYLEEQWIIELRKKYPVVINEEVLNSIE